MVLLADGSFYGGNVRGELQQYQASLTAKRAVEQWILKVLETQGPEAAKKALSQDLSAPEKDCAVLLVKRRD